MNKIKKYTFVLVLTLGIFLLTACGQKDDTKIIGTWIYDLQGLESTYVFNEDGTGSQTLLTDDYISKRAYKYETKKGNILITFDDEPELEYTYGYRFDKDNNLVLKDSSDTEFTCYSREVFLNNMTEEEKITYNNNHPEDSYSVSNAEDDLKSYFNNEEGINFNYLDTIIVENEGEKEHYYKIDVRRHNGAGANSRLDIYYIKVDQYGGGIYDSAAFKEKFGKE